MLNFCRYLFYLVVIHYICNIKFDFMCYSPLHLPNNTRKFDVSRDKLMLNVPCGNCGECRQKKQDDVSARLYYEYLDTEKTVVPGFHYTSPDGCVDIHEHGYVYLQTFTYNEEMCPWLHGIKCFRPDDYRRFMVNLRHDLEQRGFIVKGDKMPIKVYWVSEYGGETYRPHYHALFFIRGAISPELFEEMCRHNWSIVGRRKCKDGKYERRSLGWTDIENPYSNVHTHPSQLVIDGHMAVMNYVSQYIGKDIEFETVLYHQKNSHFDDLPISDDDYKMLHPFTRQSNGIGECIKDVLTIDELMDGRMTIPDSTEGTKIIALPMYIDRKVFYQYDPTDKCFRLTDDGYAMKQHRLEHNRGYVKKQLEWLQSNISQLWSDRSAHMISWFTKDHKEYSDPATAMMKVSDVLYNRLEDFVSYILYYKDISSTYACNIDSGVDLKEFATKFIVKYSAPDPCTIPLVSLQDFKDQHPVDYRIMMKHTYGKVCDRFKDFDEVLGILNGINLAFCHGRQLDFLKRRAEKARQKKIYKQFHSLYR